MNPSVCKTVVMVIMMYITCYFMEYINGVTVWIPVTITIL